MFQANDSALINPFQSFDSASLPRVKLPPSVLCGLAPELGWRYVFCLVTDITSAIKAPSSSKIAGLLAVWEEDAGSQPILIPESSYGEVQQDIARPTTAYGRGISISNSQLVFCPQSGVCMQSLSQV